MQALKADHRKNLLTFQFFNSLCLGLGCGGEEGLGSVMQTYLWVRIVLRGYYCDRT